MGEVLAAISPIQLSFTLTSGDGQPATYLTWEVREVPAGAVVRLHLDEVGGAFDTSEDVEDSWLPVITRLEALLAGSDPARPTSHRSPGAPRSKP